MVSARSVMAIIPPARRIAHNSGADHRRSGKDGRQLAPVGLTGGYRAVGGSARKTTCDLIRHHARAVPARTRKSLASRFFSLRAMFVIWWRDRACSFSDIPNSSSIRMTQTTHPVRAVPRTAGIWRSRIRQKAVDLGLDSERWDSPDLAQASVITQNRPYIIT